MILAETCESLRALGQQAIREMSHLSVTFFDAHVRTRVHARNTLDRGRIRIYDRLARSCPHGKRDIYFHRRRGRHKYPDRKSNYSIK